MNFIFINIFIPEVKEIALKISEKLNFVGACFFKLKYNKDKKLTLLEIAPHIPGAMSLYRNKGINFPLLSIIEFYDYSIDKLLINRYNISCYNYKCFENK